jgi:hypothetical protein
MHAVRNIINFFDSQRVQRTGEAGQPVPESNLSVETKKAVCRKQHQRRSLDVLWFQ